MELFLNALWFVACVLAIAALLRSRDRLTKQELLWCLASVLCAAAVVFPSISISDDIHVETFVVEDSSRIKRIARASAHANPITLASCFGSAILLLASIVPDRRGWLLSGKSRPFVQSLIFIRDRMGRAPPQSPANCL